MSDRSSSRLPLLLGVVAVLGGLVYLDRFRSPETPVAQASRPLPDVTPVRRSDMQRVDSGVVAGRAIHPLSQLRLSELTETLARPLFEPYRRPLERAAVPAPPPPKVAVQLPPPAPEVLRHRLLGVVSGPDRSTAVLSLGEARPLRVEIGDVIDGWEVTRITPTEVTLARGGRQMALTIFRR